MKTKIDTNYYFGNILFAILIWIGSLLAIFLLPFYISGKGFYGLYQLIKDWYQRKLVRKENPQSILTN